MATISRPRRHSLQCPFLQDAFVLAELLVNPLLSRETVPRALQIYSEIRMPRAQLVYDLSRENTFNCTFHLPNGQATAEAVRERMKRCWDLTHGGGDPVEEMLRARRLLNEVLGT